MPITQFADGLHAEKYRLSGETFKDAMSRVASVLSDSDEHYHALRDALIDQRILHAGRIQASIGSNRDITALNCFASGTIRDSMTGDDSILRRVEHAAETMRRGGGMGYDFSTIRPRKANIKGLGYGATASGPVSFMHIFSAMCKCIASAGNRRGAQMGILRVDHPDIEDFINVKHDLSNLQQFNLSIAITDEFMEAVINDTEFNLKWGGEVYRTIQARDLWERIMRSTFENAEPGVIFIDQINNRNNLYYCESIATTNPCSEIPLPPHGACLLGSMNLVKYVNGDDGVRGFNWQQFNLDVTVMVRSMDNVIENTMFPLEAQRKEAFDKRRLGLGITGLANAGEALGHPYGSTEFIRFTNSVMSNLRETAYVASINLAEEKGPFSLYSEKYLDGKFIKTLPEHVLAGIRRHGIRNSHLTAIAPTGTISLCADNVSSGIEPVWRYSYKRDVIRTTGQETVTIEDYGYAQFGIKGKMVEECSIDDHMSVLETVYKYVDSAVSKTVNVPKSVAWEDFKGIYLRAYKNGCKGCSTYTIGGARKGILESSPEQSTTDGDTCIRNEETGTMECGE